MHILIAPNAFKNSLGAAKAAEAIDSGFRKSKLSCTTTLFPVADGGDGTADLLIKYLNADKIDIIVNDPIKRNIESSYGWVEKDKTAIIELAAASGLRLLKPTEYDPLRATTFGTGELIIGALNKEAKKIILCIGGSATVDGGTGILQALGIKFLDDNKSELSDMPASLLSLADIDKTNLDKRISGTEIIILCDVENSLLGSHGAAKVFGPQKGASEKDVELLEARLIKLNDVALGSKGKDISTMKHGGAAGGVAAGLHAFLNARLVNGIEYFLEIAGFEKQLKKADMVITGEGSIDSQTLHGKAPYGVAKKTKQFYLPVIALAGKVPAIIDEALNKYFDQLLSINDDDTDFDTALRNTYSNLERRARQLGDRLSSGVQN